MGYKEKKQNPRMKLKFGTWTVRQFYHLLGCSRLDVSEPSTSHQGTTIRHCKWTSHWKSVLSESETWNNFMTAVKGSYRRRCRNIVFPIPLIWESTSNSEGTLTEIDLLTAWLTSFWQCVIHILIEFSIIKFKYF